MTVTRKFLGILLSMLIVLSAIPLTAASAYSAEQAALTFSDSGITETTSGSGYTISGTTLTITAAGTYRLTGSCSEGAVVVDKSLSGVTLILDNLSLASSSTAPLIIKKSSDVLLKLEGTSTLTDNEILDESNADFEGAAVKLKSGSTLTIFGDGTLNAVGNPKNAVKGGAAAALIIDGGTINATAANNGIASDGSVVINAGTVNVTSDNDGIKSQPDEGDTDSAGTVTINGGTFNINAQGDGIVAAENLTITNGDFTIKTLNGYNSTNFNKSSMSCKGLKASSNNEADADNPTTSINISGGKFNLNTADDAVHSDGYVTITGGTFDIYTGDDGVHADSTLTLGSENGYERDPEINIYSSYEGLEGSVINAYSGKFYVVASDDGMNSAGGSSNGTDAGQGGNDIFRPGQGGPGQGTRPGQGNMPGQGGQPTSDSSNYSLNIYGGDFYVNCMGDGLDSNGALNLYGGDITVLSQATGGDNSPLDFDGTMTISGATVFAAGTNPMNENPSASSQKYYTATTSRSANTVINISVNGSVVRSEKLVRNINYLLYSSPSMTSNSASVTTSNSVAACKSNSWAHKWNSGVIETPATASASGVIKYTCQDCGETERKTIPALTAVTEYEEDEPAATEATQATEADKGYAVSFVTDENSSVNVYYTQDYSSASESGATSAVSRSSATGSPDSTGDGQVNFTVVTASGYEVDSITVNGSYKNLKGPEDTGLANTYRITKVNSALTVTVTTKQSAAQSTEAVQDTSPTETTEPTTPASATESTEPASTEENTQATEENTQATEETTATEAAKATEPTESTETATKTPSLTYTKKSIKAANSFTLSVKNSGSSKVTYSSSNKKVATVNSKGIVTGISRGTATITVKVGTKKLTCKVTVTNNPVIKKGKKYITSNTTYKVKKGSYFAVRLYRKVSSIKNVYSTSNKKVAKVSSSTAATKIKIKAVKKGTATIKIKVNGVKTFKIKVKVV